MCCNPRRLGIHTPQVFTPKFVRLAQLAGPDITFNKHRVLERTSGKNARRGESFRVWGSGARVDA